MVHGKYLELDAVYKPDMPLTLEGHRLVDVSWKICVHQLDEAQQIWIQPSQTELQLVVAWTLIAHIEQGSTGYESNMNRMITGYESDKMIIYEDIVTTNRTILALTKLVGTSIIF